MPNISIHRELTLGDMTVQYLVDDDTQRIGLLMVPAGREVSLDGHRGDLGEVREIQVMPNRFGCPAAWQVEPLVHVCRTGDTYLIGAAQGRTLRFSSTTTSLKLLDQSVDCVDGTTTVTTTLATDGLFVRHYLQYVEGDAAVTVHAGVVNTASDDTWLELLTSFTLGHITPYHDGDAPGRLVLHRFRSCWSGEGRHEARLLEEIDLFPSWNMCSPRVHRFGQVGSKPVRGWFPAMGAEDTEAGVTWAAHLGCSGSWQMEAFRIDDFLALSGGLADREFGHWRKRLEPGEKLSTPSATVTVVAGSIDDAMNRLVPMMDRAADAHPEVEHDLPIVFNEWCTTWGEPSHDRLVSLADRLAETETKYLVVDAGWFRPEGTSWGNTQGDWQVNRELFPQGMEGACAEVRKRGLVPGLWFEPEVAGENSELYHRTELLLYRDGLPVTNGSSRFLDLRKDEAHAYLEERVIDMMDRCGIGYIKVDYNATIGIGADGDGSPGEALRRHIEGVHRFFRRMRERLPELVIENCSSGGHRLEPVMMALSAQSSFSDAHETVDIPIIAANLHRLVLPRQSQIWAVLRHDDSDRRLHYSLAATFLGRMCLSGEIDRLDDKQMEIVKQAQSMYRRVWPVIKYGSSHRFGPPVVNYRYPTGWQAVLRRGREGNDALLVVHRFEGAAGELVLEVPEPMQWRVGEVFAEEGVEVKPTPDGLHVRGLEAFAGAVVQLERR
ncbi:MAG: glycoside hydrolase family 36 protein [Planctomycetota bacterium]